MPFSRSPLLATILFGSAVFATGFSGPAMAENWPQWGGPLVGNQRMASKETIISPSTVGRMQTKWTFSASGNITATPTIVGNDLYFTDDWGGVYELNANTGKQVWMHWMSDYTGSKASNSRSSPAIVGNMLIVADRRSGAVVGLNRATGSMVWSATVETNPYVTLTASPVVYNGIVYIGASSNEEYEVSISSSYMPTFRGSVTALDAMTGQIKWKTSMVPNGYTGGGVWGSGFAISPGRNLLYIGTGNNYTLPSSVTQCAATASGRIAQQACLAPTDYVDSIVALDLTSGVVKWGKRIQGMDTFTLNCGNSDPAQACPDPAGPDYDFGSAPNLLAAKVNGAATELIGAGQKSGAYWALNPDTGAFAWVSRPGPGAGRGGILWGSATDGPHVYVAENNDNHKSYGLQPGGATKTTGASWAALDASTGKVRWQTPVPGTRPGEPSEPSGAEATMTVANGVVFGGSTGGTMVAMDANTGSILWSFQPGASVTCGPAISNGVVYWGSGDPYGTTGKTLYAFAP